MLNPETTRTIVGIIGNVISFGLFLSPVPTFVTIVKQKTVSDYKPDPYIATFLNCLMWVWYGNPLVHPNSLLVITINGAGLIIQATYILTFFIYSDWVKRRKIIIALMIELVFMVGVVFVTLKFFHTFETRSNLVGTLCVVFCILMYAAPLTVMRQVIRTKSVKYMPFSLSLANLFNGVVWSIYALLRFDPYILVPNGLGTISGVVQLILYGTFYKTTVWDEKATPSADLELSRP